VYLIVDTLPAIARQANSRGSTTWLAVRTTDWSGMARAHRHRVTY